MNSVDFCFWLQGYFELVDPSFIDRETTDKIKDHLNLVFVHEIDPMREEESKVSKEKLDKTHSGSKGNDIHVRC